MSKSSASNLPFVDCGSYSRFESERDQKETVASGVFNRNVFKDCKLVMHQNFTNWKHTAETSTIALKIQHVNMSAVLMHLTLTKNDARITICKIPLSPNNPPPPPPSPPFQVNENLFQFVLINNVGKTVHYYFNP